MNILFVVPYVPNLIRVRPYNLIRQLVALGHQVTVTTVWTNEAEWEDLKALKDCCARVEAVRMPAWRSLWNCVIALPSVKPLQTAYSWDLSLARASFSLIANGNGKACIDAVHVEHLRGAQYGLYLKQRLAEEGLALPIVWDSVDSISYLFRQAMVRAKSIMSRGITRFELKRTGPYESWLTTQFDHTLVTSRLDQQNLGTLFGEGASGRISVLRNGVDLDYFKPEGEGRRDPATVIASGKMSYHANVTMVLNLLEGIMPAVWERRPEVKVVVVGKDPPKRILDLSKDERITVTGTVDDIRPYLQGATVAAAPIEYGAGIQNKVLEAMACATPVVATPQAVSALDLVMGEEAVIAADSITFTDGILRLLEDKNRQKYLGENGRKYVERNHDWSAIARQLVDLYQAEIEKKSWK